MISPEGAANNTIPPILVEAFPPYSDAVLAKSGEFVTDDMLEEISEADYRMDADEHLAALLSIRDEVRVPTPMPWAPKEVLQLVRWSQPQELTGKSGDTAERVHIMRAFCCAALLRAAAEPANRGYFAGENDTLIQLIDSALFLKRGLPEATASFLTWRVTQLRTDHPERPFFGFGLCALALLSGRPPLAESDVDLLVSFVEQAERDVRDPVGVCTPDMFEGSFLEGTCYDLRRAAWRALAARLPSCMPGSQSLLALAGRMESKPAAADVERLEQALKSGEPGAVYATAVKLRDAGLTQSELLAVFDAVRSRHEADIDEGKYNTLADVMDLIVGFCAPGKALYPGPPASR